MRLSLTTKVTSRCGYDQAGQDEGLQDAHVVADEHARRPKALNDVQALELEAAAHGLERPYGGDAALDPALVVVQAFFRQPGSAVDDPESLGVKYHAGEPGSHPGPGPLGCAVMALGGQTVSRHTE